MLPLLGGPQGETRTAVQMVYMFLCWFGLIAVAAVLAGLLRPQAREADDEDAA